MTNESQLIRNNLGRLTTLSSLATKAVTGICQRVAGFDLQKITQQQSGPNIDMSRS